jgi:hypothetical protein
MYLERIRAASSGGDYNAVQQAVADRAGDPRAARIQFQEQLLLAAGWTRANGGWVPPPYLVAQLEQEAGRGSHYLHVAVAAQIQFDELSLVAANKER